MTIHAALAVLEPAAKLASVGSLVVKVFEWLRKKPPHPPADPNLLAAINKLPSTSSAGDIVQVLAPFFTAEGGDVTISAGSDGGGSVRMERPDVAGGDGPSRGGNVVIKGGDGGRHGSGGNITIIGGKIKGGDAR